MDHARVLTQALDSLKEIFPAADPAYLQQSIEYHLELSPELSPEPDANATLADARKGKRKAREASPSSSTVNRVAALVSSVSHKIWELNHGEHPSVDWRQAPVSISAAGPSSARRSGRLSANATVAAAWSKERGHSRDPPERPAFRCEVDHTLGRNKALCRLHTLFPATPVAQLRDVLLGLNHSYLFAATETLLRAQPAPKSRGGFWFPQARHDPSPTPAAIPVPPLAPSDLFRSPEYIEAITTHLHSTFPLVPRSTIRSLVADGQPYAEIRDAVRTWRQKQNRIKVWMADIFVTRPTTESTSAALEYPEDQGWEELVAEVWADGRAARLAQAQADEAVARELNKDWTPEEQLYSCGCCFDDVPFEDVGFCAAGDHAFCRACIGRQVEEHVYGGSPLCLHRTGDAHVGPGEGTGVLCLSTEGCGAPFSLAELERCLAPAIFAALSKRLAVAAIESITKHDTGRIANAESIIHCPFCAYSECGDSATLSRALPLWSRPDLTFSNLPSVFLQTLIGLIALAGLHLLVMCAIFIAPEAFTAIPASSDAKVALDAPPRAPGVPLPTLADSQPTLFPVLEPHRVALLANTFLQGLGRTVLLARTGGRPIFQCRNGPGGKPLLPFAADVSAATGHRDLVARVWGDADAPESCGRKSCMTCQRVYVEGFHKCFEDDQEGLRLAVEKAMSDAVKRNCPSCGVAFQKDSGCNKIVCRCGFTQCWACRKAIGTEGYAHFCGHFRAVGIPCQSCTKCSLWQSPDENEAVVKAANQARQAWLHDHPAVTGGAVIHQLIGPATMVERAAGQVSRVCEVFLAAILY